jgi:hypothetical protein
MDIYNDNGISVIFHLEEIVTENESDLSDAELVFSALEHIENNS